jgi:hypothetical protein
MAFLYGYDTAENFNFCLGNMFGPELGAALGPVFLILGTIVNTLVTLIKTANSLRVQFATMMGGVNTIFQNFMDRFRQLVSAVQLSGFRMKMIMGRLYGAFFAMIYMSIAGMVSLQNFTDTILFSFLDTFCFDPDTRVDIKGKGSICVKDVQMGDQFVKTGGTVTATFQFESDGQPMVKLPGDILVSTNHYVQHKGAWIQAGAHPEGIPQGPWTGGIQRPLICFNTSDHRIPVGDFLFLDYDETEDGDQATMNWIDSKLNAKESRKQRSYSYCSALHPQTQIRMADGTLQPIQTIRLGDSLSTGRVIGVVQKQIESSCILPRGEQGTPGLSFWNDTQWVRAGDVQTQVPVSENLYYNLVVMKTAMLETASGTMIRDYVEVHSPEAEQFYTQSIQEMSVCKQQMLPVS